MSFETTRDTFLKNRSHLNVKQEDLYCGNNVLYTYGTIDGEKKFTSNFASIRLNGRRRTVPPAVRHSSCSTILFDHCIPDRTYALYLGLLYVFCATTCLCE